jgi:micrococcal nuclease
VRRGTWRGPLLLVAVVVLGLSRCGEDDDDRSAAEPPRALTAKVTEVVDGDTIEVELPGGGEDDVRYIGIDTPETVKPGAPVECGGREAAAANETLVGGLPVRLRFDAERRDDYGRLLAYVYVPGAAGGGLPLFVNAELVRRGLARPLAIEPNTSHEPLFERLAAAAGRAGRGIWGNCPT